MQRVTLAADPAPSGSFAGQFQVLEEGAYRLELPVPESQNERLTRRIQVKVPELERENPQRNDALLERIAEQTRAAYYDRIAEQTRAAYYVGMPALLGQGAPIAPAAGETPRRPHQRGTQHRRPRSALGGDLDALADDRAVQPAVSGMADPALVQTGMTMMKQDPIHDALSSTPAVRATLAALRLRIRAYVWIEALAVAVAWLGAVFWASLAADWFFEPPAAVRMVILAAAGLATAAIIFRLVGRCAFVPLGDRNVASVLERRFPQLNDSLLTAVVLARAGRRRPASAPRCWPTPAPKRPVGSST